VDIVVETRKYLILALSLRYLQECSKESTLLSPVQNKVSQFSDFNDDIINPFL
jgi:hypothetical protein